ncbi:MAG: hypothetical protein COA86_01345 [Kangiella sp.]|nr:MAG: hypothetical protein COA86_01345 [Kangiella sp.]
MNKKSSKVSFITDKEYNSTYLAKEIADQALVLAKKADTLQNTIIRFNPTPLDDFPHLIKSKRKELNLNGEQVAELSGLSRSAYQKIESGKSSPKLETVRSICRTLGLTICVM